MTPQFKTITCTVNGRKVVKSVDVRASLMDFLRNDYSQKSVKKGCEVGECGACTVIIDGRTFTACIYLAIWADGKNITTAEGLVSPEGEMNDLQQNFVSEGAVQCGFCTPGMVVSAEQLLRDYEGKPLTRDQIRTGMAGNLCRCTGYTDIVKAIEKTKQEREASQ